jgi:hypothetical protein
MEAPPGLGTSLAVGLPVPVDVWVPLIDDGPKTTEIAPRKVIGRLQTGAYFAKVTPHEYEALLDELRARPTAQEREPGRGSTPPTFIALCDSQ